MGTDYTGSCKSYDHDHDGFHYQNLKKTKTKQNTFILSNWTYLFVFKTTHFNFNIY